MATRNKRKLAALNKEICEEHPRSNLAQNSNVPRSQEDYIGQVCDGHDMVTGVQRESLCGHDMTRVHQEVIYCSRSTCSRKQKQTRSTSQPQFVGTSAVRKQQQFCKFPQQYY